MTRFCTGCGKPMDLIEELEDTKTIWKCPNCGKAERWQEIEMEMLTHCKPCLGFGRRFINGEAIPCEVCKGSGHVKFQEMEVPQNGSATKRK